MRGKKGVDLLMVDMRWWDAEAVLARLGPGRGGMVMVRRGATVLAASLGRLLHHR
jgi:hypothetical protein